jgi:Arc/MetJ family transcription regulator
MLPPTEIDPDDELLANTVKSFSNDIIYIYLFVIYFFAKYIWKVKRHLNSLSKSPKTIFLLLT